MSCSLYNIHLLRPRHKILSRDSLPCFLSFTLLPLFLAYSHLVWSVHVKLHFYVTLKLGPKKYTFLANFFPGIPVMILQKIVPRCRPHTLPLFHTAVLEEGLMQQTIRTLRPTNRIMVRYGRTFLTFSNPHYSTVLS
jgi:hypothetical protein